MSSQEDQTTQVEAPEKEPPRIVVLTVRYLLSAVILVVGILFIVAGHGRYKSVLANKDSLYSAVGVALILVSASIVLLNWLVRMNKDSFEDRAKEERAREYFVKTGHWPDER